MASTTGAMKVSMGDVTQGMILKVRMPRAFGLRVTLGVYLMRIAARIINLPVEIETTRAGNATT